MPNNEVRAAIERAKRQSLNAAIGCREMMFINAFADEPAVCEMMAKKINSDAWEGGCEEWKRSCMRDISTALKALANACREK